MRKGGVEFETSQCGPEEVGWLVLAHALLGILWSLLALDGGRWMVQCMSVMFYDCFLFLTGQQNVDTMWFLECELELEACG